MTDARLEAGKLIVNFEARRDRQGNLAVYRLPSNDGGGLFEVAGINQKYHPEAARELATLVNSKQYAEAEKLACEYICKYTDPSARYFSDAGVSFLIRDIAFNRGPGGANAMTRMALGIPVSPSRKAVAWSPLTANVREMIKEAEKDPVQFIEKLTQARHDYEASFVGWRKNLAVGLRNRFAKSNAAALKLHEQFRDK